MAAITILHFCSLHKYIILFLQENAHPMQFVQNDI